MITDANANGGRTELSPVSGDSTWKQAPPIDIYRAGGILADRYVLLLTAHHSPSHTQHSRESSVHQFQCC
jgi:hypothetical protein